MKTLWLKFLCRYYYRYKIYHFIRDFVNNSPAQYRAKRFYELGNGKCLFFVAVNKQYGSQKARIYITNTQDARGVLQYSFKKVNTRLWNEIFDLRTPYLNSSKNHFWDYHGYELD